MSAKTLVCLHGFGVRGYFWEIIVPHLQTHYQRVLTPDLQMDTLETLLANGRDIVEHAHGEEGAPVAVVGHSLGAVVGALTARDLGPGIVDRAVLIAPPFGERAEVPGPLVRFLLAHKLIPDFVTRPRFFTKHTPLDIQKSIFSRAVDESAELQSLLFTERRFHTDLFDGPLSVPSLIIASDADRIVPARESRAFAERINASLTVYPRHRNIGHDDLTCSPTIAAEVSQRIMEFDHNDR
ncbi:MAG: alpha/beta fold hydrolase [Spirochaetota bacterium]